MVRRWWNGGVEMQRWQEMGWWSKCGGRNCCRPRNLELNDEKKHKEDTVDPEKESMLWLMLYVIGRNEM